VTLNDAAMSASGNSRRLGEGHSGDDSPAKAAGIGRATSSWRWTANRSNTSVTQQVIGFRKPGDGQGQVAAREVRKTFDVKLQPLNDTPQVASRASGDSDNAATPSSSMSRLGISVSNRSPDAAQ
jgi:hypothetical protein